MQILNDSDDNINAFLCTRSVYYHDSIDFNLTLEHQETVAKNTFNNAIK